MSTAASDSNVSMTTYACHVSASVGHCHEANLKHRPSMEDEMSVHECDDFPGLFIAVYDGHGGQSASHYLSQLFHRIFLDELLDEELAISPQNTASIAKSKQQTSSTTSSPTTTANSTTTTTITTTTTRATTTKLPTSTSSSTITTAAKSIDDDDDILSSCSSPPCDEEFEDEDECNRVTANNTTSTTMSMLDLTLSPSSSISTDDFSAASKNKKPRTRYSAKLKSPPQGKVQGNVPRPVVLEHARNTDELNVKAAFAQAYKKMDAVLKFRNCARLGATAVTAFMRRLPGGRRKLTIANCGDSRAILCRSGRALNLTTSHRPSDPLERKRIEGCGGFISCGRINGILNVSRAFGDHWMKSIIVCTPDILEIELINGIDEFLILACDGLWDFVDDDRVCSVARAGFAAGLAPHEVSQLLVNEALDANSTDNVSVMVVHLDADDDDDDE